MALGFIAIAGAVFWFADAPDNPSSGEVAVESQAALEIPGAGNTVTPVRRPLVEKLEGDAAPSPPTRVEPSAATIPELESRFSSERDASVRSEIVGEIAAHNDAAAVQSLSRLFKSERHLSVKESLIGALGDINPGADPANRLSILSGAIKGQPRSVRSAALGLLGQSDDPKEIALIRKAAAEDPDNEIREMARAYLNAGDAERSTLRAEGDR